MTRTTKRPEQYVRWNKKWHLNCGDGTTVCGQRIYRLAEFVNREPSKEQTCRRCTR